MVELSFNPWIEKICEKVSQIGSFTNPGDPRDRVRNMKRIELPPPIWVFPKMLVPPKHPKMIIFSRKTHGCWVPQFLETSISWVNEDFVENLLRKIAKSQYLGAWNIIFQTSWFHGSFFWGVS